MKGDFLESGSNTSSVQSIKTMKKKIGSTALGQEH